MANWSRLNMVVEGQTEKNFINELIKPYLHNFQLDVNVRIVETGHDKNRRYHGGGDNYYKIKNDINKWLKSEKKAFFTTMFDYYAFPNNVPNFDYAKHQKIRDAHQKARTLENAIAKDIGHPEQFIPYISLHEFEALLFSDINIINKYLNKIYGSKIDALNQILMSCNSPEFINDKSETAPSNRLLKLYPGYQKNIDGILIAQEIGLDKIRSACIHFNEWLTKLEKLNK